LVPGKKSHSDTEQQRGQLEVSRDSVEPEVIHVQR